MSDDSSSTLTPERTREPARSPKAPVRPDAPAAPEAPLTQPRQAPRRAAGAGSGAGPVDEAAPDDLVLADALPPELGWVGLRWSLWTAALIVAAVMVFNGVVDPRGVVGWRIFPDTSGTGPTIRGKLWRMDERVQPPGLLLLGSSRGRNFDPAEMQRLSGKPAFNASISGGRLDHAAALAGYSEELWGSDMPDIVWLVDVEAFVEGAVDPELFGDDRLGSQFGTWDTIRSRAAGAAALADFRMIGESKVAIDRWQWGRNAPADVTPWWETQRSAPVNFKRDGFTRRPEILAKDFRRALPRQMNRFAATIYTEGFRRLTFTARSMVTDTVELAARHGAHVTLVLSPMHEAGHARLAGTTYPDRADDAWDFLQEVAASHDNVDAVDYRHTESFGGTPDGYVDGVHLKLDNTNALLQALHRQGLLDGGGT